MGGVAKDREAFSSIPICLDVGSLKLTLIVTSHKSACLKFGETGYFSSCPEKKPSGSQALVYQNHPLVESSISVSLVVGMPEFGTGDVKPPVGSKSELLVEKEKGG